MAKLILVTSLGVGLLVIEQLKKEGITFLGTEKVSLQSSIILLDNKQAVIAKTKGLQGQTGQTDVNYIRNILNLVPNVTSKKVLTPRQLFCHAVENSGLKLNQIATALGVNESYISGIMKGIIKSSESNYLKKVKQIKMLS